MGAERFAATITLSFLGGAVVLSACFAPGAAAADLTARQVTEMFYKASAGAPVDLSGKDLSFLDLAGVDFKGAQLSGANLYGVDLTKANLKGSHLIGVRLDRAAIERADFSGANLERASMLRPSVNTQLGVNSANAPKFAGANLRHVRITAMMDGADFRGADLTGARMGPHEPRADISSMPSSWLRGCDFSGAKMAGADLMWAKLNFSRFVGADVRDVNFSGADLSMTDFSGADVAGANFAGADVDGAMFNGVRGWDEVKGLEAAVNVDRARR
jgi:uncharacterized protein YjbI with pentapeptide repeats